MKLLICRTTTEEISVEQPCEEAYKDKFIKTDFWGKVSEVETWFIDINSIEELIALEDKYGELVICHCMYNKEVIKIEIYDDYRE